MSIYNRIPEGYVPVPKVDKTKDIKLLRHGSITEITLDGTTFQVHDPAKLEQLIKLVERHEDRLYDMKSENFKLKQLVTELTQRCNKLTSEVKKIQEQIKNAGFDRF